MHRGGSGSQTRDVSVRLASCALRSANATANHESAPATNPIQRQ